MQSALARRNAVWQAGQGLVGYTKADRGSAGSYMAGEDWTGKMRSCTVGLERKVKVRDGGAGKEMRRKLG